MALTSFRCFGFETKPIRIYNLFDESQQRVETVVAEGNNLPWNDWHCPMFD